LARTDIFDSEVIFLSFETISHMLLLL